MIPLDRAPRVVICAPGAGLGHLIRACSIAIRLGERGVAVRIVTNSPYAEGLARLTGCAIDRLADKRWRDELPGHVARLAPGLLVLDAFPFGLRGEWSAGPPAGVRAAYLARRLHVDKYLDAIGAQWDPAAPQFDHVIMAEPLAPEHEAMLEKSGSEIVRLPGRVRLPESVPAAPAPDGLARMLETARPWLLVHSGPERELRLLLERAREERKRRGSREPIVIISSRPVLGIAEPWYEYFPASRLFARAGMVVGGAGYNLVAETDELADRRLLVPLARKYDDQAGRLSGAPMPAVDGGPAAADYLAALLLPGKEND